MPTSLTHSLTLVVEYLLDIVTVPEYTIGWIIAGVVIVTGYIICLLYVVSIQ
jgi:hypothetical protein